MTDEKINRIMDFIDEAKNDKGFNRILGWMERHPILSVIVIYIFVSKIGKIITNRNKNN